MSYSPTSRFIPGASAGSSITSTTITNISGALSETTGAVHIYLNGTTGDDANNGATALTPKATFSGAFDMIPFICKHNVAVHIAGKVDLTGDSIYTRLIDGNVKLVICGGEDTTTVAGPFTATGNSGTTITCATMGAAVDEYAGYWIKILTGANTGEIRQIIKNTATVVTPNKHFSTAPGNVDFEIVRPTTEISSSSGSKIIVNAAGAVAVPPGLTSLEGGGIHVQRLYFSGDSGLATNGSDVTYFSQCILSSSANVALWAQSCKEFRSEGFRVDSSDFTNVSADTEYAGCSLVDKNSYYYIQNCQRATIYNVTTRNIVIRNTNIDYLSRGFRCWGAVSSGVVMESCKSIVGHGILIQDGYSSFFADTAGGYGMAIYDSDIHIDNSSTVAWSDFSSNAFSGVLLSNTALTITGTAAGSLSGTSNGGKGLTGIDGARVILRLSNVPTLTGASGDITVLNKLGDAPATTWAAVWAGTPLVGAASVCSIVRMV